MSEIQAKAMTTVVQQETGTRCPIEDTGSDTWGVRINTTTILCSILEVHQHFSLKYVPRKTQGV